MERHLRFYYFIFLILIAHDLSSILLCLHILFHFSLKTSITPVLLLLLKIVYNYSQLQLLYFFTLLLYTTLQ